MEKSKEFQLGHTDFDAQISCLEFRCYNCNRKEDSRVISAQVIIEIRSMDVFVWETVGLENVKVGALGHTNI